MNKPAGSILYSKTRSGRSHSIPAIYDISGSRSICQCQGEDELSSVLKSFSVNMSHSSGSSAAVATALDTLLSQSEKTSRPDTYQLTCCCGIQSCGKIEQNHQVLESVEQDLRQAAQIGHALLTRYDNYVFEADEDRREMSRQIHVLEREKSRLERSNNGVIEENKYLLTQLESLNNDLANSNLEISSLNTALSSTQSQLDRISSLASHTTELEAQIAAMEDEQARLQTRFFDRDKEAQAALQRSKHAESKIADLTQQLDRIEREYREEQTRHQEVISRLDRRHKVQEELEKSNTRSPSSNVQSPENPASGNVVSSFVKEILQDNANLQMGIIELREMLTGSNDEVQNLREQAMLSDSSQRDGDGRSLKTDLSSAQTTDTPLHVHHHYHAASKKDNRKETALRRPRKKRYLSSPGFRSPGSGPQTPHIPQSPRIRASHAMSDAAILSQTSVSIPPFESIASHLNNLSQSSQPFASKELVSTAASLSSSYQEASVFDLTEEGAEFSRPTTPASTSIGSPKFPSRHSKHGSDTSMRSFSAQPTMSGHLNLAIPTRAHDKAEETQSHDDVLFNLDHDTIPEEPEDEVSQANSGEPSTRHEILPAMTRLHRAASAESIFSNLGPNVPTLRTMPSQLLISSRPPFAHSMVSVDPVTTSMDATGKNSRARFHDSSKYTRLLLDNKSVTNRRTESNPSPLKQPTTTFGRKLGGWMVGRWGTAPISSKPGEQPKLPTSKDEASVSAIRDKHPPAEDKAPVAKVEATTLDSASLQEALT